MKNTRRLIAIGLLWVLIAGCSSLVCAEPSLQWHTDSVHFNTESQLVIEGYFYNDGTRIVTGVNSLYVRVYLKTLLSNWWLQDETTFSDMKVSLMPGEISRWNLKIYDPDFKYFNYWDVRSIVNFRYL